MEKRGRKSAASLAVIGPSGIATIPRPDPPRELTDEQAQEWREVVNRMPADWFPRETHGLLTQYCRHVVAARRVAQLVAAAEADDSSFSIEDYDRLLKMQEREGRALSSLATRMRVSQHSQYDKTKARPSKAARKPWEI